MALGLAVLVALLVAAGATALRRAPAAAWTLLGLSALWLTADRHLEGPVLIVLSPTHGVTLSDLLSVAGAATALAVLVLRSWQAGPREDRWWNLVLVLGVGWAVLALGVLIAVSAD